MISRRKRPPTGGSRRPTSSGGDSSTSSHQRTFSVEDLDELNPKDLAGFEEALGVPNPADSESTNQPRRASRSLPRDERPPQVSDLDKPKVEPSKDTAQIQNESSLKNLPKSSPAPQPTGGYIPRPPPTGRPEYDVTAGDTDARAQSLQGKLAGLQTGISLKKQSRVEALTLKFRQIEEKVAAVQLCKETHSRGASDTIQNLMEAVKTERISRNLIEERSTKELKLVESSFELDLNVEKQNLLEFSSGLEREAAQQFEALRQELCKAKRIRNEVEQRHSREIAEEVLRLQDKITQEKKICEENAMKIAKSFEVDTAKVDSLFAQETKVREDTSNSILKTMEEMHIKMRKDIAAEAVERNLVEENVLQLLEETAQNIEYALRHDP